MGILIASLLLACGEAEHAERFDGDGDGVPDVYDCEPLDPTRAGDLDCDGWWDASCTSARPTGQMAWWDQWCEPTRADYAPFARVPEHYADCDDRDAAVHPRGLPWATSGPDVVDPARMSWEVAGDGTQCVDGTPPTWSRDEIDNDCDGVVDVPDFDGDGFLAPDDCDDCDASVHPGVDERQTVHLGGGVRCPVLAYDDVDDDCRDGPLLDFDGDGHEGGGWGTVDCEPFLARPSVLSGTDCNDLDVAFGPGAFDQCDGLDRDCDGSPFTGFIEVDGSPGAYYVHVNPSSPMSDDPEASLADRPTGQSPDRGYHTLAEALEWVESCPVAVLSSGSLAESVGIDLTFLGEREPADPPVLTIQGGEGAIVQGAGSYAIEAYLAPGQRMRVEGVRFEAGASGEGGMSVAGGVLELEDVAFVGVTSTPGAALEAYGERVSILSATFEGNTNASGSGGGAAVWASEVDIADSTFDGNTSEVSGGGLLIEGFEHAAIRRTTFSGGAARVDGGGFVAIGSNLTLDAVMLDGNTAASGNGGGASVIVESVVGAGLSATGNTAEGDGGGIFVVGVGGAASPVQLSGVDVSGNIAGGDGGGLYLAGVGDTMVPVSLSDFGVSTPAWSHAGGRGGAVALVVSGVASVSNFHVSCPDSTTAARDGGGIAFAGREVAFDTGDVYNCTASRYGGGMALGPADVVGVYATQTAGNSAYDGGGMVLDADFAALDASVAEDTATRDAGGILSFASTLVLSNTAVSGYAGRHGGGMAVYAGRVTIADSMFGGWIPPYESLNASALVDDSGGRGGGLYVAGARSAEISNTAFIGDASGTPAANRGGGAAFTSVGSVTMSSVIVTDWTAGSGGGLYFDGVPSASLDSVQISNCSAVLGGAVMARNTDGTLTGWSMEGNASSSGGAHLVALDSDLHLTSIYAGGATPGSLGYLASVVDAILGVSSSGSRYGQLWFVGGSALLEDAVLCDNQGSGAVVRFNSADAKLYDVLACNANGMDGVWFEDSTWEATGITVAGDVSDGVTANGSSGLLLSSVIVATDAVDGVVPFDQCVYCEGCGGTGCNGSSTATFSDPWYLTTAPEGCPCIPGYSP